MALRSNEILLLLLALGALWYFMRGSGSRNRGPMYGVYQPDTGYSDTSIVDPTTMLALAGDGADLNTIQNSQIKYVI